MAYTRIRSTRRGKGAISHTKTRARAYTAGHFEYETNFPNILPILERCIGDRIQWISDMHHNNTNECYHTKNVHE